MKNIAKSAVMIAALSAAGAALGADLPLRMPPPPPPPPPPLWSGLYFGLNAGGLWANNTTVNSTAWGLFNDPFYASSSLNSINNFFSGNLAAATATGPINGGNNSGLVGGGQVGFNWQMRGTLSSRVVAGVEADIQGLATGNNQGSFYGATTSPAYGHISLGAPTNRFSPITVASSYRSLNYIGTVRGRLGFLLTPTLLVFGTGGLAYGGVNLNVTYATADMGPIAPGYTPFGNSFGMITYNKTQVGWTAGGGLEWMFLPDLSAKFEYLYYDLGQVAGATALFGGRNNQGSNFTTPGTGYGYSAYASTRFNGNIVRAGVNYHLNWWAAPPLVPYI
jgi:outer membrane immunogenic protein